MPTLELMDPMVQNLFACAEKVGLPVVYDGSDQKTGDFGLYDDPGLPQLEHTIFQPIWNTDMRNFLQHLKIQTEGEGSLQMQHQRRRSQKSRNGYTGDHAHIPSSFLIILPARRGSGGILPGRYA